MRGLLLSEEPRGRCKQLLLLYDGSSADWQLGKTKVSPAHLKTSSCGWNKTSCLLFFVK